MINPTPKGGVFYLRKKCYNLVIMTLREFIDNISEWFGLNNTNQEVNEPQQYQINYIPPDIESPQDLIDRWNIEASRRFPTVTSSINGPIGVRGESGNPGTRGIPLFSGATSYYNTWCGTTYNNEFVVPKIDPKPLLRFMKKLIPFVVDIEKIERHEAAMVYDPYTFSPVKTTVFRVFVVLEPIHFAEVLSNEKFKNLLSKTLKDRLSQLINCMYEGVMKDSIVFEYQPVKTETLVEDIKNLSYI